MEDSQDPEPMLPPPAPSPAASCEVVDSPEPPLHLQGSKMWIPSLAADQKSEKGGNKFGRSHSPLSRSMASTPSSPSSAALSSSSSGIGVTVPVDCITQKLDESIAAHWLILETLVAMRNDRKRQRSPPKEGF